MALDELGADFGTAGTKSLFRPPQPRACRHRAWSICRATCRPDCHCCCRTCVRGWRSATCSACARWTTIAGRTSCAPTRSGRTDLAFGGYAAGIWLLRRHSRDLSDLGALFDRLDRASLAAAAAVDRYRSAPGAGTARGRLSGRFDPRCIDHPPRRSSSLVGCAMTQLYRRGWRFVVARTGNQGHHSPLRRRYRCGCRRKVFLAALPAPDDVVISRGGCTSRCRAPCRSPVSSRRMCRGLCVADRTLRRHRAVGREQNRGISALIACRCPPCRRTSDHLADVLFRLRLGVKRRRRARRRTCAQQRPRGAAVLAKGDQEAGGKRGEVAWRALPGGIPAAGAAASC